MSRGGLVAIAGLAAALSLAAAPPACARAPRHTAIAAQRTHRASRAASASSALSGQASPEQATTPAFWDLPGRVQEAIDGWFRGLVLDALTPTLSLVGRTVLSTPPLASNPEISGLWEGCLVTADALLAVCLLVGAAVAMSHETLQTRYALKDLLGRLAFTAVCANASLSLLEELRSLANALATALLGQGASAASTAASFQSFVVAALDSGGIFDTLLGLACAVCAVSLLVVYLLRAAVVVVATCAAPLALLCHLFPQTEGLAHLWWRVIAAAFGVQVAQALLLASCVRVFFGGGAAGLGLPASGGVVELLLCLTLLIVLVKVPFWAKELAFGRRGGGLVVRAYAVSRLGRALL